MFVRLVVGKEGEDHRELTGVITEARELRDSGRLASYESDLLEEVYEWLNTNLPVPPYSTIPSLKRGSSWFKSRAPAISQMWTLVGLLREHGVPVRLLRSRNPGRVLYEDEFQLVVEE